MKVVTNLRSNGGNPEDRHPNCSVWSVAPLAIIGRYSFCAPIHGINACAAQLAGERIREEQ
jgi:hypothetical protein